eukprot:CAMPEP_0119123308 /NCGR_PEP_ID=MMETSP1310-20130426/3288_1 /TAXON_ID=464262 /ORGANISM="Genus nov. species nov., Strain RCC2339" /LENGTH=597 /DNA_ID=CAMNT_0007113095 /DNA_START=1 /DNA_END=1794 /DNA_ORIENTATION=-
MISTISKRRSPLLSILWYRIVLDEAHQIKDRNTKAAKAVFQLRSDKKWCMTGTPIQNKSEDLFSLIKYLDVPLYNDITFWNSHVSRPIKYNDTRAMEKLRELLSFLLMRRTKSEKGAASGRSLIPLPSKTILLRADHFNIMEGAIYKNLEMQSLEEYRGYVRANTVMQNYASVLQMILRLRQACAHSYLPLIGIYKENDIVRLYLRALFNPTPPERGTGENSAAPVEGVETADVKEETVAKEDDVIDLCDVRETPSPAKKAPARTPGLALSQSSMATGTSAENILEKALVSKEVVRICLGCSEDSESLVECPCGHFFCYPCFGSMHNLLNATANSTKSVTCAICHKNIPKAVVSNYLKKETRSALLSSAARSTRNTKQPFRVPTFEDDAAHSFVLKPASTKIEALLQELHDMFRGNPEEKAIVFSQWTSMLDLIGNCLRERNVKYVRLDGSMTSSSRTKATEDFTNKKDVRVYLISLKAGGQGLNLVTASRVFLLDLWWNPATEAQAIDRVHRMGQCRPVCIVRFIIQGTIEERIIRLQERKLRLARDVIGKKHGPQKVLGRQELDLLMGFNEHRQSTSTPMVGPTIPRIGGRTGRR